MKQYASNDDLLEYRKQFNKSVSANFKDDFTLKLATLNIDELTLNRITDFKRLTPFQQELVKLAVCIQAEYILAEGDADNIEAKIASYSSLDISVTYKQSSGNSLKDRLRERGISYEVYKVLKPTGLMTRRI